MVMATESVENGHSREPNRSRSPVRAPIGAAKPSTDSLGHFAKGSKVQFFHAADPIALRGLYVCPTTQLPQGPRFLQSHGWLDAFMVEDFDPKTFDQSNKATWPLLLPASYLQFSIRGTGKVMKPHVPLRTHMQQIRAPVNEVPALSIVFVRWGGEYAVCGPNGEESSNDGDWGSYGAPPCDEYMSSFVKEGVMKHPDLATNTNESPKYEIFSLFIKNSADMAYVKDLAHWFAASLKGAKRMSCWMLWPADWEDFWGSDFSAYVDRISLIRAMRAFEAAGVRTGFPHPADQFEVITSKTWMATLALHPQARLPAATLVSKGSVNTNAGRAARQALGVLNYIRSVNPVPGCTDGGASPSAVNKDELTKGVVKLGWAWEARFVATFKNEDDLAHQLTTMLNHPGCSTSFCVVQEWVDFEFEMRLYFLPPLDWDPATELRPTRVECNAWAGSLENGQRRSFHKLTRATILSKYWDGDEQALDSAQEQATAISQFLLRWLRLVDAQPVPMVRLDFMLHRSGPGKARVFFGEFCEMGACCLGWQEGPPTIWRAALDHAMKY